MQKIIGQNTEIEARAVRAQVARILASAEFARSHRMQRFLEFVVEETLAGRGGHLGEYAIAVSVFDRGEDFEPALDPIVRNDARRLRLKLAEYYRTAARSENRVLIGIPKGGYMPIFEPISKTAERKGPFPGTLRRLAVLPFEVISVESPGRRRSRTICMPLVAPPAGYGNRLRFRRKWLARYSTKLWRASQGRPAAQVQISSIT